MLYGIYYNLRINNFEKLISGNSGLGQDKCTFNLLYKCKEIVNRENDNAGHKSRIFNTIFLSTVNFVKYRHQRVRVYATVWT